MLAWKMDNYSYKFSNVADGKWIEYERKRKRYKYTEIKRYYNDDGLVVELSRAYKIFLKLTPSEAYLAESFEFGGPFLAGSWANNTIKNLSNYTIL